MKYMVNLNPVRSKMGSMIMDPTNLPTKGTKSLELSCYRECIHAHIPEFMVDLRFVESAFLPLIVWPNLLRKLGTA